MVGDLVMISLDPAGSRTCGELDRRDTPTTDPPFVYARNKLQCNTYAFS